MAFGFYFFINVLDFARGPDDERHAGDAHVLLAVHAFFLNYAEGFADFFVGIGEQRVGEFKFFFEFLLFGAGIGGDTQDDRAGGLDFLVGVAETAGFDGAAGGIGFGIEKQDYRLAREILERNFVAVLIEQRERWGLVICLNFHSQ